MNQKLRSVFTLCIAAALLSMLSTPAFAASGFSDVPPESPYYEAVSYLAERGIIVGVGNGCYLPDEPITVRQWAIMLCKGFERHDSHSARPGPAGDFCLQRCYAEHWMGVNEMLTPDSEVCRSALLLNALHALELPVFDAELYPDGEQLSESENVLRVGKEFGIYEDNVNALDIMTRGDAAQLLFDVLTKQYAVTPPPISDAVIVRNGAAVDLNSYLRELNCVPRSIRNAFECSGWEYIIDYSIVEQYSTKYGKNCTGITSYGTEQIYVSSSLATVHEFGHFLDQQLQFPEIHENLFQEEAQSARSILREYSATNSREYFADYFAFWIKNQNNKSCMERLKAVSPQAYRYFSSLEADNWGYPL